MSSEISSPLGIKGRLGNFERLMGGSKLFLMPVIRSPYQRFFDALQHCVQRLIHFKRLFQLMNDRARLVRIPLKVGADSVSRWAPIPTPWRGVIPLMVGAAS